MNLPITKLLLYCCALLIPALDAGAAVCVSLPKDSAPPYALELLQTRLGVLSGSEVKAGRPAAEDTLIRLRIDRSLEKALGEEGYRIEAGGRSVMITAAKPNGLMYGSADFIEWVIGKTTPGLIDGRHVDIDFPVKRGQAASFLSKLPAAKWEEKPYYTCRGFELTNLALGVADLIDTPKGVEKYNGYSGVAGGFRESADLWKKWCDWLARHKMNFVSNWPYSSGTNWWELAVDPATQKMSIYSVDEIKRAADEREKLFAYAKSRGLTPYLMNYIAGAPTKTIIQNYPQIIGKKWVAHYPDSFCLSSPETTEIFKTQIRAIMRTYPSLGGLHLRWWGESFPCGCDNCRKNGNRLKEELTLAVIKAAREMRPDIEIILSGFFRTGGTKEFAWRLPEDVIIQSKWGIDWEPTSEPNVPFEKIRDVKRTFLISQALPGEEMHSIGCVHYKPLANGIMKYVNAAEQVPNLSGFATVIGEKDHEWITGTNFIAMAKLNWDPKGTNTDDLVRNYLSTTYGSKSVKAIFEALEITQHVWEAYCIDYAGIAVFADCARTHSAFGLGRVKNLGPAEIKKRLPEITEYAAKMAEARRLLSDAEPFVVDSGRESFDDLVIQTEWFAEFFRSRQLMAEALLALKTGNIDGMSEKLKQVKEIDAQLWELAKDKPNISDDFEMEGMKQATHIKRATEDECKQIDEMLTPQYIAKLKSVREIFAEPSAIEVHGPEGTVRKAALNIPELAGRIKAARLEFSLRDLDGEKPGDEAIVRCLGTEFKAPPNGDGKTTAFKLQLDVSRITPGQSYVDFILAGKPGGTAGYDVSGCRLILELE